MQTQVILQCTFLLPSLNYRIRDSFSQYTHDALPFLFLGLFLLLFLTHLLLAPLDLLTFSLCSTEECGNRLGEFL